MSKVELLRRLPTYLRFHKGNKITETENGFKIKSTDGLGVTYIFGHVTN
jgi:hypothetical protein